MNNKRNQNIDFIKGITIFLVVYGHTIQYCIPNGKDFFINKVFITIYSFHMPLFMIISGYLFYYATRKRNIKEIIKRRFKQLIIPAIAWYTIYSIINLGIQVFYNKLSFIIAILKYIKGIPYQFWFLFTLFYLTIIFIIVKKKFNDKIEYYILIFILLIVFPDILNIQYLKFMYPYFLVGYLFNKYEGNINKYKYKYKRIIYYMSAILYFILLFKWNKNYYIYTTGMTLYNTDILNKLYIISYRYIIGLCGSILIIMILSNIFNVYKFRFISKMGKYTLGIYILQEYIM